MYILLNDQIEIWLYHSTSSHIPDLPMLLI